MSFEKFWEIWPKNSRKASKSLCQKKWQNYKLDLEADLILKHVEYMKTQEQWTKDGGKYVPAPLVYINQRRWDGAEIPEVKKEVSVLVKLEEDRKKAAPMPEEIRQRLQKLRSGVLTA